MPFSRWGLFGAYKETDLIYEGIATYLALRAIVRLINLKETDLIYEGIATFLSLSNFQCLFRKKLT